MTHMNGAHADIVFAILFAGFFTFLGLLVIALAISKSGKEK